MGSFSAQSFLELKQELLGSVIPKVARHWDDKIRHGIIPTETLLKSPHGVDKNYHAREVRRLIKFKLAMFTKVLGFMRGDLKVEGLYGKQIHYVGIGTAQAFKKIVTMANANKLGVTAYDISKVACNKGKRALISIEFRAPFPFANHVFQADIEHACAERYMQPSTSRLLIAPRVLDVLDNVAEDPDKMKRTAQRIGKLLKYLKVLLIHPCPEGNENSLFRDTALYPLQQVVGYMQQGLDESGIGGRVEHKRIGITQFHRHIYTAAYIQRRL